MQTPTILAILEAMKALQQYELNYSMISQLQLKQDLENDNSFSIKPLRGGIEIIEIVQRVDAHFAMHCKLVRAPEAKPQEPKIEEIEGTYLTDSRVTSIDLIQHLDRSDDRNPIHTGPEAVVSGLCILERLWDLFPQMALPFTIKYHSPLLVNTSFHLYYNAPKLSGFRPEGKAGERLFTYMV
jgi:hypothetical protein